MATNKYINIYMGNPTADGADGIEVSTDGKNTAPIDVTLDASKAESKTVKLAVRCESGYKTNDDGLTLSLSGTNASKWALAYDASCTGDTPPADSAFSSSISKLPVAEKNIIFWVRATSSTNEDPQNDTSVKIVASGYIVAAT